MPTRRIARQSVVILALLSSAAVTTIAAERTAAEVLPASTVVFAEIRQPQDLVNTVYDHRLVGRIEALDQVRTAMEKKEYLQFKAGVAIVESQMGMPWRKIISQAMGGVLFSRWTRKPRGW